MRQAAVERDLTQRVSIDSRDEIAEETSEGASQTALASQALTDTAAKLRGAIAQFKYVG